MENDKKLLFLNKFFKEKLKDIPICEIAEVIGENLQARGVLVMIDHDGEFTHNKIGCIGLTREQAVVLFKYWHDKLIEELDSEK